METVKLTRARAATYRPNLRKATVDISNNIIENFYDFFKIEVLIVIFAIDYNTKINQRNIIYIGGIIVRIEFFIAAMIMT